ncbi:hypothetical protein PGT21_003695 [Puccinia graminis f. sp. tritici]|uniref:Uncharacterized protein n=1 Tax=Puccinia graminis f. sp. tritici TaxID=56615 RepID=A0A5B0MRM5_PUCGR|nr:hypothetical protein PGT21_003695 [Puccinia graminis f. sp. tritici]
MNELSEEVLLDSSRSPPQLRLGSQTLRPRQSYGQRGQPPFWDAPVHWILNCSSSFQHRPEKFELAGKMLRSCHSAVPCFARWQRRTEAGELVGNEPCHRLSTPHHQDVRGFRFVAKACVPGDGDEGRIGTQFDLV